MKNVSPYVELVLIKLPKNLNAMKFFGEYPNSVIIGSENMTEQFLVINFQY